MPRVLVAPSAYGLTNKNYGKGYNILSHTADNQFTIEAHAGFVDPPILNEFVQVHELDSSNRMSYYTKCFVTAAREMWNKSPDIYHHLNLSYRWFNPVLLSGLNTSVPVVVGPCQTGHLILAEEFNKMIEHAIGQSVSRGVTDPVYSFVKSARDFIDPLRLKLFKRTLDQADRIVVVHKEAYDVYANLVDESKLSIIPLGVDTDFFTPSSVPDTKEVVAIGALRERKGYRDLLKSISILANSHPDIHLHVFGDGPLREELVDETYDLDISTHVTFHGYEKQAIVRDKLQSSRLFVHPSHSESFSLVRLEAMATGRPVVVTDISGANEMVREDTEGYVVPISAPDKMAAAMDQILSDHDFAQKVGEHARKRAEEKYEWERIGEQYREVYRTLL